MTTSYLLRRLLAVLLVGIGAAVALSAPATAACPKSELSWPEQVQQADAVFTGAITDRTRKGPGIHYTVDVDRSYKGGVDEQATVLTARTERACGLPDLVVGDDYVFLATESGGDLTIAADGGTTTATAAHVVKVERLLGSGTSPTPPVVEEATFTRVAGETTSRTRVAAPGAALVIVGLLGLVLVAGLGRRRSS